MEQTQKKGMSKGCMVTLIVFGVIMVMVITAAVTCYVKKDDLARFAIQSVISGTQQMLEEAPVDGIDTDKFNTITEAFLEKMNSTELDYEKYAVFFQKIQAVPSDKKVDSAEAILLMDAMVEYFPELEEYLPQKDFWNTSDRIEEKITE